jgi:hypothetical protein
MIVVHNGQGNTLNIINRCVVLAPWKEGVVVESDSNKKKEFIILITIHEGGRE